MLKTRLTFGYHSTNAASRLVGGLSEGNVQLSIAVISDVTSEKNRSKSLALVGVAFSLALYVPLPPSFPLHPAR